MKTLWILLFGCTIFGNAYQLAAQGIGIGSGAITPHASSLLELSSTSKGVLVPRMTTAERTAIASPAQGLLVFDISTNSFWFYAGGWREISTGNGGGSGFTLPYQGALSSGAPIFSIQNTSAGINGPSILGRHMDGSGAVGLITSIWGDHTTGAGIAGTSNSGNGVYGYSESGHGMHGMAKHVEKAGVYGTHAANGAGVLGLTNTAGIGVYGKSISNDGVAGWFRSEAVGNTKNALNVQQFGLGRAGDFYAANANNTTEALKATGGEKSQAAIMGVLSSVQDGSASVYAENFYKGMGLYSASSLGIAGKFENKDVANNYPTIMALQKGLGTTLYVSSQNTGLAGPAIDVLSSGTGAGIQVNSTNGRAAEFWVSGPVSNYEGLLVKNDGNGIAAAIQNNKPTSIANAFQVVQSGWGKGAEFISMKTDATQSTLSATHAGLGSAAKLLATNANSLVPTLEVANEGKGRGIQVNLTNASNVNAGVNVTSLGQRGITVDVQGQFGIYSYAAANAGIGVQGRANGENGIGVKGNTGVGTTLAGIGVLGESGSNDQEGIGVKGVNYSGNETHGAVTGINMADGVGIYGESRGLDGIAILGIAGAANANSRAAKFQNTLSTNNKNVVEIVNAGTGTNLYLNQTNLNNSTALMRGVYAGTGNFLTLENNLGNIKTSIHSNGNITTDGAITVRENKGIVRNSASTQLRVEMLTATFNPAGGTSELLQPNQSREITVNFGTAFSATPVVYLANVVTDGNSTFMNVNISSVNTTGCKVLIRNSTANNISLFTCTWRLVAMGAE